MKLLKWFLLSAFLTACSEGGVLDTADALIGSSANDASVGQLESDGGGALEQGDTMILVDAAVVDANVDLEAEWSDEVDELIGGMGLIEPGAQAPGTFNIGPSVEDASNNFVCTNQKVSKTAQFEEYVATQTNSNVLWVGALIRGQELETGTLTEVALPRRPIRISVNLDGLNGPNSAVLDSPSLASYRDALNGILSAGTTGSTAAQLTYSSTEVHSEEQLGVEFGSNVRVGNVNVAAGFDFNSSETRSRILIDFIQAYYTVDLDTPGQAHDFFEPLTPTSQISAAFGGADAEAPAYVSSITYGRRVVFTVESNSSGSELEAALRFAYDGVGTDVDAELRANHEALLQESRIQAFVIGGNGDTAVGAVTGIEGIREFISSCGNYSEDCPGAPIAYKLNHLSDNSPARLSLTSEYTKKDCVRIRQRVKVTLKAITPRNGQANPETYGDIFVRSFNADNTRNETRSLFHRLRSNTLTGTRDGRYLPGGPEGASVILNAYAAPNSDGARIEINISLFEKDIGTDDHALLDPPHQQYPFTGGGWRRGCGQASPILKFTVEGTGDVRGGQDYDVEICLEPLAD